MGALKNLVGSIWSNCGRVDPQLGDRVVGVHSGVLEKCATELEAIALVPFTFISILHKNFGSWVLT